jgi:hypothetical protein
MFIVLQIYDKKFKILFSVNYQLTMVFLAVLCIIFVRVGVDPVEPKALQARFQAVELPHYSHYASFG